MAEKPLQQQQQRKKDYRAQIMQVSFHKCVYLLCTQFSSSHLLCNRKMENDNGYC